MAKSTMRERLFFLLFLIAASLVVSIAQAEDRWALTADSATAFSLRTPRWVLSFDSYAEGARELAPSRTFSFRLSSAPQPRNEAWRLPLGESAFVSFEATFSAVPVHPMPPGWTRPALQAVVGLGVEF